MMMKTGSQNRPQLALCVVVVAASDGGDSERRLQRRIRAPVLDPV